MIDHAKKQITLSSGFDFGYLVKIAQQEGFAGAESFAGIPGTIGGAICGNAGAYGRSISDLLVSCDILTKDGKVQTVDKEFMQFDYRMSRAKKEPIVINNPVEINDTKILESYKKSDSLEQAIDSYWRSKISGAKKAKK